MGSADGEILAVDKESEKRRFVGKCIYLSQNS
jgi:hypothetical protein